MLQSVETMLNQAGISFEVRSTQWSGHAVELTQEAIRQGHRHLVAFGGDGTVNEVANGILRQALPLGDEVVLTQFPIGTGNDWRRTHGIPKKVQEWPSLLTRFQIHRQDVGLVKWSQDGSPKDRYFVNIAGVGFEALAGKMANDQKAAGKGGIMSYVSALLKSLRQFHASPAVISVDDRPLGKMIVFSGAIGICKFNGGGMKQCPDAIIDDGLFDFTLIGDLTKWEVIRNIPGLFSGKFVSHPAVQQLRASEISVECDSPIMLEVDGENIGTAPATFHLLPGRLQVAVPG